MGAGFVEKLKKRSRAEALLPDKKVRWFIPAIDGNGRLIPQ